MINILKNFPKENDVIINGCKNCLMASGDVELTLEIIGEKLNLWCEKIKNDEEKRKKKRP